MRFAKSVLCAAALWAVMGPFASAQAADESVPSHPFRTVHLLDLTPAEEVQYRAALRDLNRVFIQEGCSSCVYRLFRAEAPAGGPYHYMMVAEWPGRDTYVRLHDSPEYAEAARKNPIFDAVQDKQFYGRFVEFK
jgi:hypothetical protein